MLRSDRHHDGNIFKFRHDTIFDYQAGKKHQNFNLCNLWWLTKTNLCYVVTSLGIKANTGLFAPRNNILF